MNVQWCRSSCVFFYCVSKEVLCGHMFVGEVIEVTRMLWSKFKVCVSVLTRMKLSMQRVGSTSFACGVAVVCHGVSSAVPVFKHCKIQPISNQLLTLETKTHEKVVEFSL